MSINDPRIEAMRLKWNAFREREERAYVSRNGNWNGASRHGHPLRFVIFCQRIEQFERARIRFAEHAGRVEFELRRADWGARIFEQLVALNRCYATLLRQAAISAPTKDRSDLQNWPASGQSSSGALAQEVA